MTQRLNSLFACLFGCVIASLLGLLLMLKFDTPMLAMLCAGAFPAIACWIAGITDKKQLCKIACYAVVGWILTLALEPGIAQSAVSRVRRLAALPLVGYDWHVPASFVSTLLALIGTWFVPLKRKAGSKNAG